MKIRELLRLIETSEIDMLHGQVLVTNSDGDLHEVLSAEIDADGDLMLTPDLNVTP